MLFFQRLYHYAGMVCCRIYWDGHHAFLYFPLLARFERLDDDRVLRETREARVRTVAILYWTLS